jgi:hypothetical protein
MFLAGEFPHKIEAVFLLCSVILQKIEVFFAGFDFPIILRLFFAGFEGVLGVRFNGSQNVMGSGYGSNISRTNMK